MSPITSQFGPNVPHLVELTKQLSAAGKIDNIENLLNDRLYIFTGKADRTVVPSVVNATKQFFTELGVDPAAIEYIDNIDAGHAIITSYNNDTECNLTQPPFINDCDFMQSFLIFNQIYSNLNPPATTLTGEIIQFKQKEFITDKYTSMAKYGYAYVPQTCHSEQCRLHVVFHGCEQGAKIIGDDYYAETGYNFMAETNQFVVLYPQIDPSQKKPFNPKGCWDFWGYSSPETSNPDFFTQQAPQIKAVKAMIDRLAAMPTGDEQ